MGCTSGESPKWVTSRCKRCASIAPATRIPSTYNPRSVITDQLLGSIFLALAVIIVVARLMRLLMLRIGQPAVVGEIIGGVLLGPSLLGIFPGHLTDRLFPPAIVPFLNVIAQLGVIIYMFIVGLELDVDLLRGKGRVVSLTAACSIAVPFGLGILLADQLYSSHLSVGVHTVRHLPFVLFIAVALSVTSFPVLARILNDRRMNHTRIGALALACAAVDDIMAWSMLAVVLSIAHSSGFTDVLKTILESIAFVMVMFFVVRPLLRQVTTHFREEGHLSPIVFSVILIGLLISAYVGESIGIKDITGAFLFGAIVPRQESPQFYREVSDRLEPVSLFLLLPVFFVVTGLSTNVRNLGSNAATELPLILLVAMVGKFVGAAGAARVQGVSTRRSIAIGTLINTRGLTGLVILSVGLTEHILDQQLFTMLVIMAIVTTLLTTPVLKLSYPERFVDRDIAEAEREALGVPDAYRVLVDAGSQASIEDLVRVSSDLVQGEDPREIVLSRFSLREQPGELAPGVVGELTAMAGWLTELRTLAKGIEQPALSVTVRSQFSSDPPADLAAQARAVDADIVLLGSPDSPVDDTMQENSRWPSFEGLPGIVAALEDDGASGVKIGPDRAVVVVGNSAEALPALELAARLARSRKAEIVVDSGGGGRVHRGVAIWIERLARAGWRVNVYSRDADTVTPNSLPGLLVKSLRDRTTRTMSPTTHQPDVPVLVVRATDYDPDRNLEDLVNSGYDAGQQDQRLGLDREAGFGHEQPGAPDGQ